MPKHEKLTGPSAEAILDNLSPFQVVASDSPQARQVFNLIGSAPTVNHTELVPPFIDYAQNTPQLWRHVPDDLIRQYLRNRFFMETRNLEKEAILAIERTNEDYLSAPTDLIVNVAGFRSWEGRNPIFGKSWQSDYGHGKMSSLNVIKHYAALPSELPPVSLLRMFVEPSGRIFFDNAGGDSHRIAAAILRGDSSVRAEEIDVYKVGKNYLEETLATRQ